jgi:phage-related protein
MERQYIDIDLPGNPEVWDFRIKNDDLYVAFSTTGSATAADTQTVTNNGTRKAYPIIVFERSGGTSVELIHMKNETTGAVLYFDYSLLDGEKITIDLTPRNRRITSNQFGNVIHACLRPSNFVDFFLLPGNNSISVLVTEAGGPTTTAYMQWRTTHWSADGVAP